MDGLDAGVGVDAFAALGMDSLRVRVRVAAASELGVSTGLLADYGSISCAAGTSWSVS